MLKTQTKQPNTQLFIGLGLVALAWTFSWLPHALNDTDYLRTHILFFPLWLGYCLTVDDLTWRRKGSSLLRRNWRAYVGLFLISAPAWWFFEVVNWRTANWEYLGREQFSDLAYALLASLSFSTVIPAVFGTAELVSSFDWLKRLPHGPRIPTSRPVVFGVFLLGVTSFALMMVFPRYFFPFIWLSPFFILTAINLWMGNRSLVDDLHVGNWRPAIALMLGALICGFFWEMWNFYSYPKWIYHVPYVDFWRVFEMPILGYGGYLPFGLELFAMVHFALAMLGRRASLNDYVQLD
jgi:hypothetical protein